MSLEAQSAADAAFILEDLGIPVTHRPRGVAAADELVQAIVEWEKPERDMQSGPRNIRKGSITVLDSVAVTKESQWVINGSVCVTTKVGSTQGGRRSSDIQAVDKGIKTGAEPKI